MRLSTAELEKLVKVEEETADDEYALSEQSEPTATEVTVGSSSIGFVNPFSGELAFFFCNSSQSPSISKSVVI